MIPDSHLAEYGLLIVTGSTLRAEQVDRPLAYRLKESIEGHLSKRESEHTVVVLSDLWYLNSEALQRLPVISVGGPGVNAVSAHLFERLSRRTGPLDRDDVRGHEATRRVFTVSQQVDQLVGSFVRQRIENSFLFRRIELSDEIGGVVIGEFLDELGTLLHRQRGKQLSAILPVLHLRKRLGSDVGGERGQQFDLVGLAELLHHVREIGRVQIRDDCPRRSEITLCHEDRNAGRYSFVFVVGRAHGEGLEAGEEGVTPSTPW